MGFFSQLANVFTGDESAKAAQSAAERVADAERQAAAERSRLTREGMDRSLNFLSPYAETGGQANALLADLLGLNGPDRARGAYANFFNPPGFQEAVDFGNQNAMQGRINFGGLRSGATLKALQDVGQRSKYGAVMNWLDRLGSQSGMGVNVAGRQSDITGAGYNLLGDIGSRGILGAGQAEAGGIVGAQNARTAGFGNLVNTGMNLLRMGMGMPGNNFGGSNIGFGSSPTGWLGNTGHPGWIQA